ncbi:MAG: MBL fold metallo-hydrolase [Thermomicrobiales bacterium]|nr:MBL fold metallo-hydrolase [Thermomicrobiales bacterium]
MRLTRDICLVGGGNSGFNISAPLDCHIYVIDGGDEVAIVDAGMGGKYGATEQILANIAEDGVDPDKISTLLLTHYHADHAGGAADFHNRLGVEVLGSPLTIATLAIGDEEQISLPFAKSSGFYPADYVFEPCPGRGTLTEGATFNVGELAVTVYETPGHSDGHVSLLVSGHDRTYLIGGDLIFYGGTIIAQNIPDCSIQNYAASTLKMAEVDFDALLPGHLTISLSNGKRHVDQAAAQFRQLMIPRNAV